MNLPARPALSPGNPVPRPTSSLGWPIGGGLLLVLAFTMVVGLQLGAMPWRFRRELWQVQGGLGGGAAGLVVGYALGRSHRRK
jgi:hypothetical protein